MAKQNSATDPVSAAMSAIESALNLTDDDTLAPVAEDNSSASPPPPAQMKPTIVTPVLKPAQAAPESTPLLRPSVGAAATGEADAKPSLAPPANDDRETVGAIVQALNVRPPSRTPFYLAILGSLVWLAVCGLYAWQNRLGRNFWLGSRFCNLLVLDAPETALLALAALGPIFFMFGFAALSRRFGC